MVPPGMSRHSASDQEIQKWIQQRHGLQVETYWIAHCRELCGITESTAERREWQQCPPEKLPAIKQAFRHFGMLSPEE